MRTAITLLIFVASTAYSSAGATGSVEVKVGDPAPPFTLAGSDGRTYRLADFRGKQVVVLAWFAKAFTSG